jgi:hypothetical protein
VRPHTVTAAKDAVVDCALFNAGFVAYGLAHGGTLELRTSPSGAAFRLTLPLTATNS